jgi:uncharacterized protein (DUF1330 family)
MSAFVIAQFDVNDVDMYYEYASKIFETTKGYGGRILAANDAEVREGSIPHLRTIVGEFPSLEKARAWYESEGYQAIIGLRQNSTTGHLFMVEGLAMPPRDKKAGE